MEDKVYYTSKEARELLNTTTANLKYIEDALSLDILRDENNKRMYSKDDLECFKQAIRLRKRGYGYKEIKEQLKQNEVQENPVVNEIAIDKFEPDLEDIVRKVVKEELTQLRMELYKELDLIMKQNKFVIEEINKFSDNLNYTIASAVEDDKKSKGLFKKFKK